MTRLFGLLLIIACLYALGAFTLLVAGWLKRWPMLKAQLLTLGSAACNFALGFTGLLLVVLILRGMGLLPEGQ